MCDETVNAMIMKKNWSRVTSHEWHSDFMEFETAQD